MKKRLLIFMLISVCVVGILAGCACGKKSRFVGEWELKSIEKEDGTVEKPSYTKKVYINSDGTATYRNHEGTWKVANNDENKIIVSYRDSSDMGDEPMKYDEDRDVLYEEVISKYIYERVK